jgi:protein-arginine kinase activator protein McsA
MTDKGSLCEDCEERPATRAYTYVSWMTGFHRLMLCDQCASVRDSEGDCDKEPIDETEKESP